MERHTAPRAIARRLKKVVFQTRPLRHFAEFRYTVRRFYSWLCRRKGYRRRIDPIHVDYLNLPHKERRIARVARTKKWPKLEETVATVAAMPGKTPLELRDRALVVLLALTGIRIGAVLTLRLKHIDMSRLLIHQKPGEVDTKFGNEIYTVILPFDKGLERILIEWIGFLRDELGFGDNHPLFPKTEPLRGKGIGFGGRKLSRKPLESRNTTEKMVMQTFEAASFHPHTPHSFRHMIGEEMQNRGLTVDEVIAWSRNPEAASYPPPTSRRTTPHRGQGRCADGAV